MTIYPLRKSAFWNSTLTRAYAIDDVHIDPKGTIPRLMNMGIAYNTMFVTEEEAPKWHDLLIPAK